MSDAIYNDAHVVISSIIGREFNNPLGASAFPILARLTGAQCGGEPAVLDAGCGRGRTAIWWAGTGGGTVDGFDPSEPMLAEARQRAESAGLGTRIRFFKATFSTFRPDVSYDLVIAHDVLAYCTDRGADTSRLASFLKPRGVMSVTDYWADPDAAGLAGVIDKWGITTPARFGDHVDFFAGIGLRILFHFDTTRQYRAHWARILDVVGRMRPQLEAAAGTPAVETYRARVLAILAAVDGGGYGHCWSILEAPHDHD